LILWRTYQSMKSWPKKDSWIDFISQKRIDKFFSPPS
jgi:hypothetical protein